jgi:hypothetical protein
MMEGKDLGNVNGDDLSSIVKPSFQKLTGTDNYQYWEGQMRSTLVFGKLSLLIEPSLIEAMRMSGY